MKTYPKIGSRVKIKDGGEIHTVKDYWKPKRVVLDNGKIFLLSGIEQVEEESTKKPEEEL